MALLPIRLEQETGDGYTGWTQVIQKTHSANPLLTPQHGSRVKSDRPVKDDGTRGRCGPFALPCILSELCTFVQVKTAQFHFQQA